ncbi:MAG: hypothetical protein R2813_03065 [Flavobacteriales bacterium]
MKSLINLIALGIGVVGATYATMQFLQVDFRISIIGISIYMIVVSFFFESVLTNQANPKQFITMYMAFSGGKMFLSLFILLIYIYLNRDYMMPFAVSFLGAYFIFTGFEIGRLLRFFKK